MNRIDWKSYSAREKATILALRGWSVASVLGFIYVIGG